MVALFLLTPDFATAFLGKKLWQSLWLPAYINEKMKSLATASITGFGALVGGWIFGSLLVPNIPSVLLPPTWTLELSTSLVAYLFLFLSCTFLK